MAEALKQRNLPASVDKPVEEEPSVTPTHAHLHNVKTVYRFTPRHNGSTLLDSYELRAVTNQLNKAMQEYKITKENNLLTVYRPMPGEEAQQNTYKGSQWWIRQQAVEQSETRIAEEQAEKPGLIKIALKSLMSS